MICDGVTATLVLVLCLIETCEYQRILILSIFNILQQNLHITQYVACKNIVQGQLSQLLIYHIIITIDKTTEQLKKLHLVPAGHRSHATFETQDQQPPHQQRSQNQTPGDQFSLDPRSCVKQKLDKDRQKNIISLLLVKQKSFSIS